MNVMKIKNNLYTEKGILFVILVLAGMSLFQAVYALDKMYMAGYFGMSLMFFSVAGLVSGFMRMAYSSAEISPAGIHFTQKNHFTCFLSAKDLVRADLRHNRKHMVTFLKEDGGYVDAAAFLMNRSAAKFLEKINWKPDRNSEAPSGNCFSPDILVKAEGVNFLFSWKDEFSLFNNLSLAGLFSGILLLTGSVVAADMESGFQILTAVSLIPWIIFIFSRFRKEKSNPALFFTGEKFFYGRENSGDFLPVREIKRNGIRLFRYNYDLTTSVQSLHAVYEEDSVRISLPGLNLCDGLCLSKKLNEMIAKEN